MNVIDTVLFLIFISALLLIKILYVSLVVSDGAIDRIQNPRYTLQMTEGVLLMSCVLGLLLVHYFQFDFIVADFLYKKTQWASQDTFIVNILLHKITRVFLIALMVILGIKLFRLKKEKESQQATYDLFILMLTVLLSVGIVSLLKRMTEVDCPWDLLMYGGSKPFYSLFNYPAEALPSAHCFPASHASVGFSWVAAYFYFLVQNNRLKTKVLVTALLLGCIFAAIQQLRGAHFISHDISSLLICLLTSVIVYSLAYRSKT